MKPAKIRIEVTTDEGEKFEIVASNLFEALAKADAASAMKSVPIASVKARAEEGEE